MNTDKLKGIAVVSQDEGAKLGQVDSVLFDPATLQLRAFQIKGDRQTFIVPLDRVQTIGADAIMVESSQATQTASKGGAFDDLVDLNTLKRLKVVDAAGTFVGTLRDLELDLTTGRVLRIAVHKGGVLGLGGAKTMIEAATIRSVGRDVITVSEVVAPATA